MTHAIKLCVLETEKFFELIVFINQCNFIVLVSLCVGLKCQGIGSDTGSGTFRNPVFRIVENPAEPDSDTLLNQLLDKLDKNVKISLRCILASYVLK